MKTVFESPRIRFVEVDEALVDDYLTMVNDVENVQRFIGKTHEPFSVEKELRWVREKREEQALVFSMLEMDSGRFIGNIELMEGGNTERELGIALTAEMQNRGYGTEAVSALTAYALDTLGFQRVFLRTDPANARAIHVYQKCGFREYDRDAEHVYMEYTR